MPGNSKEASLAGTQWPRGRADVAGQAAKVRWAEYEEHGMDFGFDCKYWLEALLGWQKGRRRLLLWVWKDGSIMWKTKLWGKSKRLRQEAPAAAHHCEVAVGKSWIAVETKRFWDQGILWRQSPKDFPVGSMFLAGTYVVSFTEVRPVEE